MKKYILLLITICSICGCQYPESELDNISLDIIKEVDNQTKKMTLRGRINVDLSVSEYGFCYSSGSNHAEDAYPTIGLNKHIIKEGRFSWTFGEEILPARIYNARAYIIVNGIAIYSENTVDVNIALTNLFYDSGY